MQEPYDRAASRHRFWTNIALAIPVVALIVFLVSYEECDACGDWDYVQDLLLDNGQNEVIYRWVHAPSVSARNGNAKEVEMVAGAVYELNQQLSDTGFALRFTRADTADIEVTFDSREELGLLDPDTGVDAEADGYATWMINQNDVLHSANIYVVRNLQPGRKWGTILHELGHTVGIVGHTDRYYSSLFHSELGYGSLSDGYSSDDRKLLSFLYRYLQPGAKEPEVRAAFDKYWVLRSN